MRRDGYHAQYRGLVDVAAALQRVFVYDGRYSDFRGRTHGRPVGELPSTRFVGFLQNHDQVGNRARGERIGHLVPPDALRAGAALVLLGPFVPLLFAGEEWSATSPFQYFTDHQDEALGAAVREGRRREFPAFQRDGLEVPDPQAPATFDRSRLDWAELERQPHASVLDWYRQLIAYRSAHPALHDGTRPAVKLDEDQGWIAVARGSGQLVANFGPAERTVPLGGGGPWRITLASSEGVSTESSAIRLPGWSAAVVEPGPPR